MFRKYNVKIIHITPNQIRCGTSKGEKLYLDFEQKFYDTFKRLLYNMYESNKKKTQKKYSIHVPNIH